MSEVSTVSEAGEVSEVSTASDQGGSDPLVPDLWAVIPAGGAGTRLWPLSRSGSPKFLRDLTGSGSTLLQQTAGRLEPVVGDRLLVVTGVRHAVAVRDQLPALPADGLLIEPAPRDSMAAIGWAAAVLEARDPDAILGSFAADHVVRDVGAFQACVQEAAGLAASGHLVTIGITPTSPATGFGYIRAGAPLPGAPTALTARSFVEKPDQDRARSYLAAGDHLWNAGMFIARAATLLDLLGDSHPAFAALLRQLARDPDRLGEIWPTLPRIAIDHAVAEPAAAAGRVVVVPGDFGWDDIGDFDSLAGLLPRGPGGGSVLGDADLVRLVDSTGLVVAGGGRLVTVLGLDDVVVVDTPDVLLVTTRARAQQVKSIVDALVSEGRGDLT